MKKLFSFCLIFSIALFIGSVSASEKSCNNLVTLKLSAKLKISITKTNTEKGEAVLDLNQTGEQRLYTIYGRQMTSRSPRIDLFATVLRSINCGEALLIQVDRKDYPRGGFHATEEASQVFSLIKGSSTEYERIDGTNFGFPVDVVLGLKIKN
jgi:hypothetical protein